MSARQRLHFLPEPDGFFTSDAILSSWEGYQDRTGPYGSEASEQPSSGKVQLWISREDDADGPASQEVAAGDWLIAHEEEVAKAVVAGIIAQYSALQELYGYSGEERRRLMPDLSSAEDLKSMIGLHAVHMHPLWRDGVPYLGFEIGCTWDDEHGLGVMMHGTRVVEIGGADTAFLTWIADRDAQAC